MKRTDLATIIEPHIRKFNEYKKLLFLVSIFTLPIMVWGVLHLGPFTKNIILIYSLIIFLSGYNCGKFFNIMTTSKKYVLEAMNIFESIKTFDLNTKKEEDSNDNMDSS